MRMEVKYLLLMIVFIRSFAITIATAGIIRSIAIAVATAGSI